MAKLKNPLFAFSARGALGRALTLRKRRKQTIAEQTPIPQDAKTPAQLLQRQKYCDCIQLWYSLTDDQKALLEAEGRAKHMSAFACWQHHCLSLNPPIWVEDEEGKLCPCLSIFMTGNPPE